VEVEHYAAVPGPDRDSLVVVDGRLPRVVAEHSLTAALAAFAPLIGDAVYLRLAASIDSQALRVFDTGTVGDTIPFTDADPERLAPPALRPQLERWLAEQQGGPIPELRAAWARPGWHAQAEAWAGCRLRQVRVWPLSAVLEGDGVFFKAVFRHFHHEPAITQALARESPGLVPDVVRIDEERGWMLMRPLHGEPGREHSPGPAFRTLEELQAAWRDRTDELLALGAQDRRLHVLAEQVPEFADLLRELGDAEALGHGDFHGDNVVIANGRATIYDWSDACVAHPDLDRYLYAMHHEDPLVATASCLHQHVSYRAILDNLAPDDQWWFEKEPERWLQLARENAARPG